jgi:DNA-binding NarL/FixJ family response regulator
MSETILIVEDHDAVRVSLRDWLRAVFPRCHVLEAATGEEAVAAIDRQHPPLVVMDIGLPGMNGIETTRRIKAAAPEAQIVILTIHDGEAYRADATAAGASAFVPKSRMQTELVPALMALLGQKSQNSAERENTKRGTLTDV